MTIHVKICGITDSKAAESAVAAGADAIGFVFAPSVRRVSPREAGAISADLKGVITRVAVFLKPTVAEIMEVLEHFEADLVQADHDALVGFDLVETLPVFREADAAHLAVTLADGARPRLLYEGARSGAGRPVDWLRATEIATRSRMTLAGGLDPDNVEEAIQVVSPFGVDVSSGVESAPGVKDPGRIRDFIAAARANPRIGATT